LAYVWVVRVRINPVEAFGPQDSQRAAQGGDADEIAVRGEAFWYFSRQRSRSFEDEDAWVIRHCSSQHRGCGARPVNYKNRLRLQQGGPLLDQRWPRFARPSVRSTSRHPPEIPGRRADFLAH